MKLIISLNWTLGILLIIVALGYPFVGGLTSNARYSAAERTTDELIKAENRYFTQKNRYLSFNTLKQGKQIAFDKLGLNAADIDDHEYEAYISNSDGLLVVRAIVSPSHVRDDLVPPAIYEIRMRPEGESTRRWILKGESAPGLGLY